MAKYIVALAIIFLLFADDASAKHRHVRACAAVIGAPCSFKSIGGGITVPMYVYRKDAP